MTAGCSVAWAILLTVWFCMSVPAPQLPARAVVYLSTAARFKDEPSPVKVVFYQIRGELVGVRILGLNRDELVRVEREDVTLGLYEGTGVYDVTGDGWPEVVMIGGAGAKTLVATIYQYEHGQLRQIFETSGYLVKVVHLRGRPVITSNGQYGTLSNLFAWENGQFREANDTFPEFYEPEIEHQRKTLRAIGYPAYVYAQACQLGATALVYGRKYAQAEELCREAYGVVQSSLGLIPSQTRGGADVLAADREAARQQIEQVLRNIRTAEREGKTQLPGVSTAPPPLTPAQSKPLR